MLSCQNSIHDPGLAWLHLRAISEKHSATAICTATVLSAVTFVLANDGGNFAGYLAVSRRS
jgi:hypothetical protein